MPTPIKGYRPLTEEEIALMNEGKELSILVGNFIEKLEAIRKPAEQQQATAGEGEKSEEPRIIEIDYRWLAIGKTDLQKGFMSVIRSIARPETF